MNWLEGKTTITDKRYDELIQNAVIRSVAIKILKNRKKEGSLIDIDEVLDLLEAEKGTDE